MFVPSVERIHLPRNRSRSANAEVAANEARRTRAVTHALGGLSAASIRWKRQRWSWLWAVGNDTTPYDPPHVAVTSVILPSSKSEHDDKVTSPVDIGHLGNGADPTSGSAQEHYGTDEIPLPRGMAIIHNRKARFGRLSVCWAGGSDKDILYMASFLPASNAPSLGRKQTVLSPSVQVGDRFEAPVLQVVSSPFVSPHRLSRRATAVLVRTQQSTHFIHAVPDPSFVPPSTTPLASFHRIGCLTPADTENRAHVDVALDPSTWGRAVVVDEGGGVWLWWEATEYVDQQSKVVLKLSKLRSGKTGKSHNDAFYRVAFGNRQETILVMSRSSIEVIDLLSTSGEPDTLCEIGDGTFFTSLEMSHATRTRGLVCAATNREVLWVDDVELRQPIFRWKHHCGGGISSDFKVISASVRPSSTTTSSYVVMVQDERDRSVVAVQVSELGPLTLLSQPWSETHLSEMSRESNSFAVLPPDYWESANCLSLFAVGSREAQASIRLRLSGTAASDTRRQEIYHGRWAWIAINETSSVPCLDLHDFAQEMREFEASLKHFVTVSELARDSAYQSAPKHRSNLLRAMLYPTKSTADVVASAIAVAGFTFHGQVGHPPATYNDEENQVHRKGAAPDTTVKAALNQDLRCSATVVASDIVDLTGMRSKQHADHASADDVFAAAASSLSLDETVPCSQFSCLAPKMEHRSAGERSAVPALPFVRSLLGEWSLGEDPTIHTWSRPQNETNRPPLIVPRPIRPLPTSRQLQDALPALDRAVFRPQGAPSSPPQAARSSPARPAGRAPSSLEVGTGIMPQGVDDDTLPAFLQTQQEPGPFGARPEIKVSRKKGVRRRQGGF